VHVPHKQESLETYKIRESEQVHKHTNFSESIFLEQNDDIIEDFASSYEKEYFL
jgi:hypothetical protein